MLKHLQNSDYSFKNSTVMNDNLQFIDFINNTFKFETQVIPPDEGYKHQGDLFSLFKVMDISPDLYVYTMYLNGYTHPHQYNGEKYDFKIAIKPQIPTS